MISRSFSANSPRRPLGKLLLTLLAACMAPAQASANPFTITSGTANNRAAIEPVPWFPPIQPRVGEPLAGLSPSERARFFAGKVAFIREYTDAEGLGPIFNRESCASCHGSLFSPQDLAIGGTSIGLSESATHFGLTTANGVDPLTQLGGSLLQFRSIQVPPSAPPQITDCQEIVPTMQSHGVDPDIVIQRITTPTFGAGLVEAIADADIESNVGIAGGQAHYVNALEDISGPLRVGRFGWKAQLPTVLSFSADASLNEMGLTSRLLPDELAPNGDQAKLDACDVVPHQVEILHPEDNGVEFIDRITDFQRYLAPPPQTPKSGMSGEEKFIEAGCADCHRPSFTTSKGRALEAALRGKTIKPYSDFLLHDMGSSADNIPQSSASETQLRTPPLWGLARRIFFRHSGIGSMADPSGLDNIIAGAPWDPNDFGHNVGDATQSANYYINVLTNAERLSIYEFLRSLGRPEFDTTDDFGFADDGRVTSADIANFEACYASDTYGAGMTHPADHICAINDIDANQKVNDVDLWAFAAAYQDVQMNCDCSPGNTPDLVSIIRDGVPDIDNDGFPDVCQVWIASEAYPSSTFNQQAPLEAGALNVFRSYSAPSGWHVYFFVDLNGAVGNGPSMFPPPLDNLCTNVKQPQNLLTLLGHPTEYVVANSLGSTYTELTLNLPGNPSKIAIQAIAVPPNGAQIPTQFQKSPIVAKDII